MGIQALILAAGRGSRMEPKAEGVPKPLLEVGRRPLIEHMLETLADAGVGPVCMILGYCADEIREVVGIRSEYIHNPRWATTNSLYSFSLAKAWVRDAVMILNCDLLVHPEIIDRLLKAGEDTIAYDSSSGNGREQMADKFRHGSLIDMSKEFTLEEAAGENVGILYLSRDAALTLFAKADEILAADGETEWLGAAVRELAREREIRGVDVAGLPWVEIDFPYDLERARKVVWPEIQRTAWKRKAHWRVLRLFILLLILLGLAPVVLKGLFPPQGPELDTVELTGADYLQISMGERRQKWWVVEVGQTTTTEVAGPDTVRIETRLILDEVPREEDPSEEIPYVIEVLLDGESVDWFKLETRPSKTAQYEDWIIGKRRRLEVDIPKGQHVVGARLVAGKGTRSLIRFRQTEPESD